MMAQVNPKIMKMDRDKIKLIIRVSGGMIRDLS
jgi:hypothetical protein